MKKVFLRVDSKGTQEKYRDGQYWYKKNQLGNEGMAEMLSSLVLNCSEIPSNVSYVSYELSKFIVCDKEKHGCRSINFLNDGEEYVSIQTLFYNITGKEIENKLFSIDNIGDRFDYICAFVEKTTGLNKDFSNYLKTLISLDYFTRNPDRHWGNIGIIMRSDGSFKSCPVFDNGQAFGQNFNITPPDMPYEKAMDVLTSATLCGSFETALQAIGGPNIKIDFAKLQEEIKNIGDCPALLFLKNRIHDCEKIFGKQKADYEEDFPLPGE